MTQTNQFFFQESAMNIYVCKQWQFQQIIATKWNCCAYLHSEMVFFIKTQQKYFLDISESLCIGYSI